MCGATALPTEPQPFQTTKTGSFYQTIFQSEIDRLRFRLDRHGEDWTSADHGLVPRDGRRVPLGQVCRRFRRKE